MLTLVVYTFALTARASAMPCSGLVQLSVDASTRSSHDEHGLAQGSPI